MTGRESGDSETDYAQLNIELQDRPNPLPMMQSPPKTKGGQRSTNSTTPASLTAPLLDDSHSSLPRVGSLPRDPNAKYRPEVTDNRVHISKVEYRCVDWLWFLMFLGGLYAGLLALLYGLLIAAEKDSESMGFGCLGVFIAMGICLAAVIIRGELKHHSSKRFSAQSKSPSIH